MEIFKPNITLYYSSKIKNCPYCNMAKKYLDAGFTNLVYEFIPEGKKANEPLCLISFKNSKIRFIKPVIDNLTYRESDKDWFNVYLKLHLLSNLKIEELALLAKTNKITKKALLSLSKKLSFRDIFEGINNGI